MPRKATETRPKLAVEPCFIYDQTSVCSTIIDVDPQLHYTVVKQGRKYAWQAPGASALRQPVPYVIPPDKADCVVCKALVALAEACGRVTEMFSEAASILDKRYVNVLAPSTGTPAFTGQEHTIPCVPRSKHPTYILLPDFMETGRLSWVYGDPDGYQDFMRRPISSFKHELLGLGLSVWTLPRVVRLLPTPTPHGRDSQGTTPPLCLF